MGRDMSETLVRNGPGTAMGDLMRCYWTPILRSSETYHGPKFGVSGECVDVPCAPHIAPRISIKAYPCILRGGIVWASNMGPADKQPTPPEVEWCTLRKT